jgi:hypothetical protein
MRQEAGNQCADAAAKVAASRASPCAQQYNLEHNEVTCTYLVPNGRDPEYYEPCDQVEDTFLTCYLIALPYPYGGGNVGSGKGCSNTA